MNSIIRSTVAAGKGQLLKASTRAVPLGSVADHSSPHLEGLGQSPYTGCAIPILDNLSGSK